MPHPLQGREEEGISYVVGNRGASRVFHRNSLISRQSATLADWVSRLPVCASCRLSFPSIVPPTYALPHVGCLTRVPRLIPSESVPPYGLRLPRFSGSKRCSWRWCQFRGAMQTTRLLSGVLCPPTAL